jgi:hypothetical protein
MTNSLSAGLSSLVPFARFAGAIVPAAGYIATLSLWGARSVYSCLFDDNGKERQDLSKTQKTMIKAGAISLAVVGGVAGGAVVASMGFLGGLLGGLIGRNAGSNSTDIIIGLAVGTTLGSAIGLCFFAPLIIIEIRRMRHEGIM